MSRADTTPLLVRRSGAALHLERVPFGDHGYDEAWLQQLLFEHPALLPVDELEPVFAPLIAVARELPTASGPFDLFCVSPEGYPTLVETKLWRNPEARRQVVAQAIDYAAQLSRWSYDRLVDAVRGRRTDKSSSDPLRQIVNEQVEALDDRRFVDTLSRNLQRGRILLLIVGDGIHESVEQMADTLAVAPHLGFTLGLVELSLFRLPDSSDAYVVHPRIVMRTREVLRAVVELRGAARPENVQILLPPPDVERETGKRVSLTMDEFYRRLEYNTSEATAVTVRDFVNSLEGLDVEIIGRQASLSLHYVHPATDRRFSFGSIKVDGSIDFYFVRYYIMREGVPEQIALDYLNVIARPIPHAQVQVEETKTGDMKSAIRVGARHVNVEELLPHSVQWRNAIAAMIDAIDRSLDKTD